MSNESQGTGPVATVTPGQPIYVNVQAPKPDAKDAATEKASTKRAEKRAEKKADKVAAREYAKGENSVIKALGIPKGEREGLLREIKETRSAKALQEKLVGEHRSRAEKAETELTQLKSKVGAYETLAKQYADDQFNALDENTQKFIAKQAGESLERRLELIGALKESGMLSKQEAAAATAQAKAEEKPVKPATTSAATNPKAPSPAATPTPRQQWEQMKSQNPRLAAQFYAANQYAIDRDW